MLSLSTWCSLTTALQNGDVKSVSLNESRIRVLLRHETWIIQLCFTTQRLANSTLRLIRIITHRLGTSAEKFGCCDASTARVLTLPHCLGWDVHARDLRMMSFPRIIWSITACLQRTLPAAHSQSLYSTMPSLILITVMYQFFFISGAICWGLGLINESTQCLNARV